ncbi:MAG: hypothetical protein EZS28_056148, partial [Streblomastix strix]
MPRFGYARPWEIKKRSGANAQYDLPNDPNIIKNSFNKYRIKTREKPNLNFNVRMTERSL